MSNSNPHGSPLLEIERLSKQRDELVEVLRQLLASDPNIAQATDRDLEVASIDLNASYIIRKQARSVLIARQALSRLGNEGV